MAGDVQSQRPPVSVHIIDPSAARVCNAAGIIKYKKKLVALQELRAGLDITVSELEAQRKKDQIVAKALMVARFTKATCDAFIGMAASLSQVFLPKAVADQADAVNRIYGAASPIVEGAATEAAGGKVDYAQMLATSAARGAPLMTGDKGGQLLIRSTAVKVEVINAAMNHDNKKVISSAAKYVYDLNVTAVDLAGSKKGAAFARIAKQAFTYNEDIGKAFDELLKDTKENEDRYSSQKATIARTARNLSRTIREFETFIESCQEELDHPKGDYPSPPTGQPSEV
jgi:hypothetical protein